MITISKQDFLKNIYKHQENGAKSTSASLLADALQVSNAAVSEMSKKLSSQGLLHYQPYKELTLTKEGQREALKVVRRHRLWELFLIKTLDMNWAEVHDEADKLEHLSSEFLINKIDAFLEFPHFDPHGSPIPDKNGVLPKSPKLYLMADCEIEQQYLIARVIDKDQQIMRYLQRMGLLLNVTIYLKERFGFDNSIHIDLKGKEILISEKVAQMIFLERVETP